MRFLVLSLIAFLVLSVSANAAVDTAGFIHFHIKNGLPSNNVYSVVQDRNGYYWFASDHGIVKYNGYSMQVFNAENGSLPSDDVYDMWEDSQGRMWLKTFSDKIGYIKNGKFRELHYPHTNRIVRTAYFSEYKGIVYFTEQFTEGMAIVFANDDFLRSIVIPHEFSPLNDTSEMYIVSTGNNLKVNLWTRGLNLYEISPAIDKIRYIGKFPDALLKDFSYGLFGGPENKISRGRTDNGDVVFLDVNTMEFNTASIHDHGAGDSERVITYLPYYTPGNFSNNTTLFTNSHMYTFDRNFQFVKREKFSDVIPTNQLAPYRLKDSRGNMWYTTNGDGAFCKPSFYEFYAKRNVHPDILNAKNVGRIGDTIFWWEKSSLSLYEVSDGKVINIIKPGRGTDVKSVAGNAALAYISTSKSVYEYDRRKHTLISVADKYTLKLTNKYLGYTDRNVSFLLHGTRGGVLIGNTLTLLTSSAFASARIEKDTIFFSVQDEERFTTTFFDIYDSVLYAYSNNRIFVKDIRKDEATHFDMKPLERAGVNSIKQIGEDAFGNMFILDEKSLSIYDERRKEIRKVDAKFSFSSTRFGIKGSKLYIAGKFGIAVADIKGRLAISDFKVLPNIVHGGHERVEDLILYSNNTATVQTDGEVFTFSLDSLDKYAIPLTKTADFFSLILLEPSGVRIKANDTFTYSQKLNLVRLDVINSYGKGEVSYSYRIDNAKSWEQSTSGEIFIATLKPGIYHKVECMVKDEVWKSNVHTFYIYRTPYWWQTQNWQTVFWIAGILFVVVLVLITMVITRYYSAKKDEKKRALTELELRAIHAQINPHFIFNTLSAALFFINKKRFDDAYVHVNKFSRLLRSYLKSSQNRYVILGEEIDMLRNYIELQQIRFEEKFTYTIEIDNKLPVNNIQIPSLLLQPLVENAINHGLFHSVEAGKLSLKFMQGESSREMICEIEDNGVGREASRKINESSSTKESYGTKLTNKLLDIFREYEHMDITLDYTDKPYPNTGTLVTLTLKNLKYIT